MNWFRGKFRLSLQVKATIKFLFLWAALALAPTPALADCLQEAQLALNTCQSNSAINGSKETSDKIMSDFKPKNDRMSAESCQGFKESYKAYDKLTDDYIDNCRSSLIDRVGQCLQTEIQGDAPDKAQRISEILKLQNQAVGELPKLKHLKAPMPKMKAMLDDCLRQTQGKDIKNTNKDRGNADMNGDPSRSSGADAGNSQANQGQGGDQQSGGGSGGGGSGGGGSGGGDQGSGNEEKVAAKAKLTNGSTDINAQSASGAPIIKGYKAADSPTGAEANNAVLNNSPMAKLVKHQQQIKAIMLRKPASNDYGIQGLTGPHTDMFNNVKTRYREMKAQGEFL